MTAQANSQANFISQSCHLANEDAFTLAGKTYRSRLLVGTGKYRDLAQMQAALEASGAQIVTIAIRRLQLGAQPALKLGAQLNSQLASQPNAPLSSPLSSLNKQQRDADILSILTPDRYTLLPNSAGCYRAEDAVYTLQLARELLNDHRLVKLEVLGDAKTLFPNMPQTLKAAEILVREGFQVMAYCSDDPVQCQLLEQIGCVAVMPLASLIGSGMGILNPWNLSLIVEQAQIPVLIDAGVGTASDAAIAMEHGCTGVLMNSAIAGARDPILMAHAMRQGVAAGRLAYLAGRIPKRFMASASSPTAGQMEPVAS